MLMFSSFFMLRSETGEMNYSIAGSIYSIGRSTKLSGPFFKSFLTQ
ncbi:hypothetical protein MsAc7_10710 [Methanolapillus millepedarum]|uniref:Uncharacterized protein n=1 Tax=Methanolapillus millepedarum TaxID=3028296 RepID=A0AA96ZUE7_9EURY|nr:hypothetical protein MsAc7_10710 [Methanosarcinaceae archaeon Ac7]